MIPPIVDVEWWRERADSVVLADVRSYLDGRSGAEAYRTGHLPGAVFVDLDLWLAAHDPTRGRHPLPEPAVFAEGMARLGIGDDSVVVAYDDQGGVMAARLVWMLRSTGHDAALLDGGMAVYDGPLETETPAPSPTTFTPRPWPQERLADLAEAAGGSPSAVVLDARAPERYRGEVEPIDPRAGHIPGARNLPTRGHLDDDSRFLPVERLQARFASVGITGGSDVISYCGSGVTACHNLLALEHAGLGLGRLYPGSWSEYSTQPGREVATGEEPGGSTA